MQYYNQDNGNFDENGDFTLQPINAKLKVELMTTTYEIEVEIEYDKEKRWTKINEWGVLKVPVFYSNNEQLFRIYDIEKNLYSITIKARHIFYDLINKNVIDVRVIDATPQEAFQKLLEGTNFIAVTNSVEKNNCYFEKTNVLGAINGDSDNTIKSRWNLELLLDNFTIYALTNVGDFKNARISYSNNMQDISLTIARDNIATRLYPVADNNVYLPERYIDSPLAYKYPTICEQFLDLSGYRVKTEEDNNTDQDAQQDPQENVFDTEEELYEAMRAEVYKAYEKGIDRPTISGSLKATALENALEYEGYSGDFEIGLGDTMIIYNEDIDIDMIARIISAEWDILSKEFISITFGRAEENYFERNNKTRDTVNNIVNDTTGKVDAEQVAGTLRAVLITNKDDSFQIDLKSTGGATFKNNGQNAIKVSNNSMTFYNWKKKDAEIGAIKSLILGDDEDKPVIGFSNNTKSMLSLGYSDIDDDIAYPSYIEFDKYNIRNDNKKIPIRVLEDMELKDTNIYNFTAKSYNGENEVSVGDHFISLSTKECEIVVSNSGVRIGKQRSFWYDAKTGEITIKGNIKDGTGKVILEAAHGETNPPDGGGSGDWKNGIMSANLLRFIKGYEGLGQYVYRDSGGTPTIGYGITNSEPDTFNKLSANQPVSEEIAAREAYDVNNKRYGKPIVEKIKALGCKTQQQFDALVDLAYNCGTGVIGADNSLMNALRRDITDESYIRPIWEKFYIRDNSGQALEGLRLRRKAEADIFFKGIYEKRKIPLLNKSGAVSGNYIEGDGWLPISSSSNSGSNSVPDGFKTVDNDYGTNWIIPVSGCRITAGFPVYPSGKKHDGMDFGCPIGTPVHVSKDGVVIKKRELTTSYGKYLFVDHGGGLVTIYAHNSQLLVNEGDKVRAGQVIAKSGNTGNSTGPHLHWELRVNGVPKDIAPLLHTGDYV